MRGLKVWLFLSLIPIEANIKIQQNFQISFYIVISITRHKITFIALLKQPCFSAIWTTWTYISFGLANYAVNSQTNGVMFCEVRGMTKFFFLKIVTTNSGEMSVLKITLLYFLFNTNLLLCYGHGGWGSLCKGKNKETNEEKILIKYHWS